MLSETIKTLRKTHFLNQTAFANLIGVTQGTVSQWENGLTRPNADQLKSISEKFNISIDSLLRGEKRQEQDGKPKTEEARIISGGIDKLPKAQREQALAVMRAMFAAHAEYFEEKGTDNDT